MLKYLRSKYITMLDALESAMNKIAPVTCNLIRERSHEYVESDIKLGKFMSYSIIV
jgi:hypothetical protein